MKIEMIDLNDVLIDKLSKSNIYTNNNIQAIYSGMILHSMFNAEPLADEFEINVYSDVNKIEKKYNLFFDGNNTPPRTFYDANNNKITLKEDKVMTKFFKSSMMIDCEVYYGDCETDQQLVVISKYLDIIETAIVSSMIPRFFKSLLTKSQLESIVPYLKSIIKTNAVEELDKLLIENLNYDWDDITYEFKKSKINNCMHSLRNQRKSVIRQQINKFDSDMQDLLRQYRSLVDAKNRAKIELIGFDHDESFNDSINDLSEFLFNNKMINITEINDNIIKYDIRCDIVYYDEEVFENTIKNSSFIFEDIYDASIDKYREILKSIFIDRKYKIRSVSSFYICISEYGISINIDGCRVSKYDDEYENIIPGPHPMGFNCAGEYPALWNEAIASGNYIEAISYTMSLAQNINWADYTVVKYLINAIFNKKCIEDKDGNIYSAFELISMEE